MIPFQEIILRDGGIIVPSLLCFSLILFGVFEYIKPLDGRDCQRKSRWIVNFSITVLNIIAIIALPISVALLSVWAKKSHFGLFNNIEFGLIPTLVFALVMRSFTVWLNHFLMHKVPLFWRVHRVHHFDTFVDISSPLRFHPFEIILNFLVAAPFIIYFGLPLWGLISYDILNVVIIVFSHANIKLPKQLDALTRILFVTPEMHRVHHSSLRQETESNFGVVFSFWDRLFKTYIKSPSLALDAMELGLESPRDSRVQNLYWLLVKQLFIKK